MTAARASAWSIGNGGNIRDYEGVNKTTKPMPPFLAINTTAGTASEMTRFCIITNTDTHVKMAIVDWRCTPNIAINDPVLMVGKPPALTAATGMDALTHAVEAYVSTIATPITDACAIKAIELIAEYLRPAVANGENLEARDKMAYAEYLAGMAFNNASLGYVHAMAHQLGGFYNLPHGVCNAILLPAVCEFNLIACREAARRHRRCPRREHRRPVARRRGRQGHRRHPQAVEVDRHPRRPQGARRQGGRPAHAWPRTPRRTPASSPTRAPPRSSR